MKGFNLAVSIFLAIVLAACVGSASPRTTSTAASMPKSAPTGPTGSHAQGTIRRIEAVSSSAALGGQPGVEIEVSSDVEFPVRNELVVLRVGARESTLSRYPESGDTHTLIFTLTLEEFAQIATGDLVTVYYGRGGETKERWNFGPLDKSLGAKSLPPQGLYDGCDRLDADCLAHLDKMAKGGFKLVISYGVFDHEVADILGYADHAAAVGMKVIWDMSSRPYRDGGFDRDYIRERVEAVRTHPATWGYYVADEPSVTLITSPSKGAVVSAATTIQAWSWIHPGVGAFSNIQFLLDGANLGMIAARSTDDFYSLGWDTTQVPNGPHLIQARVQDDQGYTATSEPVYVTVDNPGPPGSLRITTANLPSGAVNASYSAIVSVSGGAPPYGWRVSSGSLPAGLSVSSSSGVISGIPSQAGRSGEFAIEVRDSASSVVSGTFAVDVSASWREEQALVRNFSDFVHSLDPAHPRLLVHFDSGEGDRPSLLRPFVDAADVIAFDSYTLAQGVPTSTVGDATLALEQFARENSKQWGFVLQSFDNGQYSGTQHLGWPSRDRMREERDLVLANGDPAFILWYSYFDIFSQSDPDPAGHWDDLVAAAFSPPPTQRGFPLD